MTLPLPPEPDKPDPRDCCGSGCVRCILDVYEEQLAAWKAAVSELEKSTQAPDSPAA